jgi:hypothetical protein
MMLRAGRAISGGRNCRSACRNRRRRVGRSDTKASSPSPGLRPPSPRSLRSRDEGSRLRVLARRSDSRPFAPAPAGEKVAEGRMRGREGHRGCRQKGGPKPAFSFRRSGFAICDSGPGCSRAGAGRCRSGADGRSSGRDRAAAPATVPASRRRAGSRTSP